MRESEYFLHPSSVVDEGAVIGNGTKIWHFCHVMADAQIGENCNLGQNVFVASGVQIGNNVKVQNNVSIYTGVILKDDVFLGPSMVFTNVINPRSHINRQGEYQTTLVENGVSIGANATIICGVSLGKYAFVGAGTVVTKDVPAYGLVYGNPGQLQGWMCRCGERLIFIKGRQLNLAVCGSCGSEYLRIDEKMIRWIEKDE